MYIINICGVSVDMLLDIALDIYGLYVTTDNQATDYPIYECNTWNRGSKSTLLL